jgi:hypothetical protein
MKLFISLIFIALLPQLVSSAPMPVTSSSFLIQSNRGVFYSNSGFRLTSEGTDWVHSSPESNPFIVSEYRAPRLLFGVQSAVTVRVNKLKHATTLKKYVKDWVKDYPKFGLDILSSKPILVNKQLAFLVDTKNKNSKRQLRQIVFLKNKVAVIMTCRSHVKSFNSILKSCNQIFRNFSWTQ